MANLAPTREEIPSRIEAIVVSCFRDDLHLLRICIASIRHWHPDVPVYLLKDVSKGPFSTDEIEASHDVQPLETEYVKGGWGLTKIEALFGDSPRRVLLLDSDTVLLGPVLETLEQYDECFLVTGERDADPNGRLIKRDYINVARVLAEFDPDYRYPGYGFNSGQLVVTRGLLTREDFAGLVHFGKNGFAAVAPKGLFPYADQGILNYVLAKATKRGVSVRYLEFWCWSGLQAAREISLERIRRREGYPLIMHWAGTKKNWLPKMDSYDLLQFFRSRYYQRLPYGKVKLVVHELLRFTSRGSRKMRNLMAQGRAAAPKA